MHVNPFFIAAGIISTSLISSVHAAPIPTVGDLSIVQAQTIMYEAKAKRADAKAKMIEGQMRAGQEADSENGISAVTASEIPTVSGISGSAGRLYATFMYPNGNTSTAKSGEIIPGGFTVAEVSLDRAVIVRGDRRIPLQSGSSPNASAPGSGMHDQGNAPGAVTNYPAPSF